MISTGNLKSVLDTSRLATSLKTSSSLALGDGKRLIEFRIMSMAFPVLII